MDNTSELFIAFVAGIFIGGVFVSVSLGIQDKKVNFFTPRTECMKQKGK